MHTSTQNCSALLLFQVLECPSQSDEGGFAVVGGHHEVRQPPLTPSHKWPTAFFHQHQCISITLRPPPPVHRPANGFDDQLCANWLFADFPPEAAPAFSPTVA